MMTALVRWLEDKSDWLSPIVVKEVRQVVRGREFAYSFGASLVAGLAVAFFGAADALTGSGNTGSWTFFALMGCVAFLGLGVVPLGAFNALRTERMEQTLELITLTELTPRRIVIGKLLAQSVKLATLFAAVAPFVAMTFLLGGIDFLTIILSLAGVFLWSLWVCALCLFLSTLLKSRAMSGLVFGVIGIGAFMMFGFSRTMYFVASRGTFYAAPTAGFPGSPWWVVLLSTSMCLATMINLVLLAENRLALPTENKVTPLRVGFLIQFLVFAAWMLSFVDASTRVKSNTFYALGAVGGVHLAIVALFAITEDLVGSRRTRVRERTASGVRDALAMFRAGGGRGAIYVLAQMAALVAIAQLFDPNAFEVRWLLAACGYVCFFTGVPTAVMRALRPARAESLRVRVIVFATLPAMLVLPDLLYYLLWRPDVLSLNYSRRHLLNPFRTLANWVVVEKEGWLALPLLVGLIGVVAYLVLIRLGIRMSEEPEVDLHDTTAAGEPGRADVLY